MTIEKPEEQFERLLKPYALACYNTAFKLTGSQTDAEDLVQELFIKLFKQFEQWRTMENPFPWIKRVLYNLHIDMYRKKARTHGANQLTDNGDDQALESLESPFPSPMDEAENRQRQQRILLALDQLDGEQRALVILHLLEGHTLDELANLLEIPIGTLKARFHRAKAKLKNSLNLQPFSKN